MAILCPASSGDNEAASSIPARTCSDGLADADIIRALKAVYFVAARASSVGATEHWGAGDAHVIIATATTTRTFMCLARIDHRLASRTARHEYDGNACYNSS
jgi:hypothetical protein